MRINKNIIFGCLVFVGVLLFMNKDKMSMVPKKKLEIDPEFTLMVVDSNAYETHRQRILNLETRDGLIKEMAEELLNGLVVSTSKQTQGENFTLKKLFDLYEYKIDYLSMQPREEEHVVDLLTSFRSNKAIKEFEENYILDMSFFRNCVVTLKDSWYFQLGIPLSTSFIKSQKQQNLILRQIHDFEQVDKLLEPITINKMGSNGIGLLKDFAAEEFLGVINPNPFWGPDDPNNIELNNLLLIKKLIKENPSYKLAVFYSPN